MGVEVVVSLARLGLQALENVVQDVTENLQLLAAVHALFRTAHPESSNSVGEEEFSVPALGFIVGVDPDGVVVAHPGDEFLVLDGDDAFKRRNLRDQRYGVTNKTERLASKRAERLVQDEHRIAGRIQWMVRRRFCSPSGGRPRVPGA